MHYDDKAQEWIGGSGRRAYANCDLCSLDFEDDEHPMVYYGNDGTLWSVERGTLKPLPAELNHADMNALADIQIELWMRFKAWLAERREVASDG